MTNIYKVQAVWSGFPGGPGVSTFYSGDVPSSLDPYLDFFEDISGMIPTGTDIQVQPEGVSISRETGELTGGWSADPVIGSGGTADQKAMGGSGSVIRWTTGAVKRGRRVYGRTFIVPLGHGNFTNGGTMLLDSRNFLKGAATTLRTTLGTSLVIWSRPTPSDAGTAHPANGEFVPEKAAQLRTRRD